MENPIPSSANRSQLRDQEWTDPSPGTGYFYSDEEIPHGHDTDNDLLPDGWEVEFGLDPRDDGLSGAAWDNGPFGDPDGDGIWNYDEYLGQDGLRSTTDPYINGTGDETNPNRHFWRPDSSYQWRWLPENAPISYLTDARPGTGISRSETLGSALPTAALTGGVNTYNSLGYDSGYDSDDDGIPDYIEINAPLLGLRPSSPVHSTCPYIPKSVLIRDAVGIPIPDPEPAAASGFRPAGLREDLQGRDWTIECFVKLLDSGLNGELFNFSTNLGGDSRTVYRLALTNNVPVLVAQNNNSYAVATVAAKELPTDEWVHLAGVWDHERNTLSLYIHGILQQGQNLFGESASIYFAPATNTLALASSADGSFVDNLLLDEVRIWGIARSAEMINKYSKLLLPQHTGDDVWLNEDASSYYSLNDSVLVNGGSLFEGQPGLPLDNVFQYEQSFWIDNGDGIYRQNDDIILKRDIDTLVEGAPGTAVGNAYYSDKDGSGGFSAKSLLAYYRFDDGGVTAEDFARKAKSGLIGATRENYSFGDFGYALPSDNFEWVESDYAPLRGAQPQGADDSDGDGLPDAWEVINHLDPYDDGTAGESAPGRKDGPYGAAGDPDGDGLNNIYEYWSQTNPLEFDTDGDGSPDSQNDFDGDGVSNGTEQSLGSRPDLVDTDDDGLDDGAEQSLGTDPASSLSPAKSYSIELGGTADDFVELPSSTDQRLESWTIEAWVKPTSAAAQDQIILRRVVENLDSGSQAHNYVFGLRPGAGDPELFAGYVGLDGQTNVVADGSIAVGEWSHVATTYDIEEAVMSIYTNGVLLASTSQFYAAPPLNGKGGDTFTRIGENFDGMIDDLRLWNTVRSAEEITENYEDAIPASAAMVHYLRFDDGIANEDRLPFGERHRPAGVEDYRHPADWNSQWAHAGIISGGASFANESPIVTPASLQVLLEPDQALLDSARWSLDGGAWNESGATLIGLAPGEHSLAFKSISGWTQPASETVIVAASSENILRREYIENGSVTVAIEPLAAVADGAAWRIGDSAWQGSEDTIDDLSPGFHYVEFQSVTGWNAPVIVPVEVRAGEESSITRFYTPIEGPLQVVLLPAEAVADGARWRVDGGEWRESEDTTAPLEYGSHIVEFEDIAAWDAPTAMNVFIDSALTSIVTGRYTQTTGVHVELSPTSVSSSGAVWRVSGGEWRDSGTLLELEPGNYTLEFGAVDGWVSPAPRQIEVLADVTTQLSASYYRSEILGEFGTGGVPGRLYSPRGMDFGPTGLLYVADTDNHCIQVYDPANGVWHEPIGSNGTAAGQFRQPMDVFFDQGGNLYVADSGNNRVQRRAAGTGVWTVWGGTAAGTGLGQFDGPFGVAVDATGNIYVADTYNQRVQRRAPDGIWSVLIAGGFGQSQTRYPRDLLIAANGNLLLADHLTTPAEARLREFSPDGAYVATLAGSAVELGGFAKIGAIELSPDGILLADMLLNLVSGEGQSAGDWSVIVGEGLLSSPEGLAYSVSEGLFVADTANHRIVRIDIIADQPMAPDAIMLQISTVQLESEEPEASGFFMMSASSLESTAASSAVRISWNSDTNSSYSVQEMINSIPAPAWQALEGAEQIDGDIGSTYFIDTNVQNRVKLYRVIRN
jgi:sugar lactone lactonase YvrE